MRILIALMFFAPLVAMLAVKNGVEQVTPILMVMAVAALVLQVTIELRQRRD